MSRFPADRVTVALAGGCQCPGQPHAQDEVYLLPRLSWEGGSAAEAVIAAALGRGDAEAVARPLVRAYLEHQVAGWNLAGPDGAPLPYDVELLLSDWSIARAVGEAADELYSEALLAPLVASASKSSPAGPTGASTSARTRSASGRRRP